MMNTQPSCDAATYTVKNDVAATNYHHHLLIIVIIIIIIIIIIGDVKDNISEMLTYHTVGSGGH